MQFFKEVFQLTFIFLILLMPVSTLAYLIGAIGSCPAEDGIKVAKKACLVAGGMGIFFALTGSKLFLSLGIGLPTFKIFAGILLFVNGFSLLKLKGNQHVAPTELKNKKIHTDIAITPLAFPLLTGPATIGQLIAYYEEMKTPLEHFTLCLAIVLALIISFCLFYVCLKHLNLLSTRLLGVAERLTGLFAITLATQCTINGINGIL
ncbi:MAG: hypothetical protein A2007_04510 [Verrucomicrobia bacterium GWC2_42_7]|nr:MAG: hypothetical protein A2007_04510 [Verrucomicrobia bacterium GWC2_42_7]